MPLAWGVDAPANDEAVLVGSGNPFLDLGCPDPGLSLAKADLVLEIRDGLGRSGPVEVAASARRLGLSADALLDLLRGRTGPYALSDLERLRDRARGRARGR